MRRYSHLPGRKFTAVRAIVGGAALVVGLFAAAGPVQAAGLSAAPVPAARASTVAPTPRVAPAARVTAVHPGAQYVIIDKELCSTGFAVTSATGQDGFVTAGHCGSRADAVQTPNGDAMGSFADSTFPGTDYGWVTTNARYVTTPAIATPTGVVAVHGDVPAAVGSPVCLLGQASGWHCGTITATSQTVQYDQGLVSGLTATTVCSDAGDSGGVFISGDQAQGVASGGIGDCSANGTTYFQPVKPILAAYGLTLRTG